MIAYYGAIASVFGLFLAAHWGRNAPPSVPTDDEAEWLRGWSRDPEPRSCTSEDRRALLARAAVGKRYVTFDDLVCTAYVGEIHDAMEKGRELLRAMGGEDGTPDDAA